MCPEKQILSVYFDGELPTLFKAKLESHIDACGDCRAMLNSFAAISAGASVADDASVDDKIAMAQARVWDRLNREPEHKAPFMFGAVPAGSKSPRGKNGLLFASSSVFRHNIAVPLPFAAAASILVIFALGVLFFEFGRLSTANTVKNANRAAIIAGDMGENAYYVIPRENFEMPAEEGAVHIAEVMRFFDENDTDMLDMRLPERRNFNSYGEPRLIPASNYTQRTDAPRSRP
jgi:hypothetical protein